MNQNPSDMDYIDRLDDLENHSLSKVLERNIRTILKLRVKRSRERKTQDRIADAITDFSGHLAFVYIHMVWFVGNGDVFFLEGALGAGVAVEVEVGNPIVLALIYLTHQYFSTTIINQQNWD